LSSLLKAEKKLLKGEKLIEEGGSDRSVFIVVDGGIELHKNSTGIFKSLVDRKNFFFFFFLMIHGIEF
jgi:hypothetical protein